MSENNWESTLGVFAGECVCIYRPLASLLLRFVQPPHDPAPIRPHHKISSSPFRQNIFIPIPRLSSPPHCLNHPSILILPPEVFPKLTKSKQKVKKEPTSMTNSRVINLNSHFIRLGRSNLNILDTELLACFPSYCRLLISRLAFSPLLSPHPFSCTVSTLSLNTEMQLRTSQTFVRAIPQLRRTCQCSR